MITECVPRSAISKESVRWYMSNLEAFYADDPAALEAVMGGNAARLLNIDSKHQWWEERWGNPGLSLKRRK